MSCCGRLWQQPVISLILRRQPPSTPRITMATIGNDPNGRKRILFVASDGKRRTLRLGKSTQRQAEAVKVRVEQLAAAKITGHTPDADTLRWLSGIDAGLYAKLVAVGLAEARETIGLAEFIDGYIAKRTDVKPASLLVWGRARNKLVEFFGEDESLSTITAEDAQDWRRWLGTKLGSENTIRKMAGVAKQFLQSAVRSRMILVNPFADLVSAVGGNRDKLHFIDRETAAKVIDACPDAEWRLLFALSRYAGLRCPSEHLTLRWEDIDWHRDRMTVTAPKTEHHEGKGIRIVPIFPALAPYLAEAFEQAEPGAEFVITRYRRRNCNLRTQLLRIMKRAGVSPWPRLFHNLRSSCQTELEEQFPSHVVCAWIGNSEAIARRHYLQVTEQHFNRAAQNLAQQVAESACTDLHGKPAPLTKPAKNKDLQAPSRRCNSSKWTLQDSNL